MKHTNILEQNKISTLDAIRFLKENGFVMINFNKKIKEFLKGFSVYQKESVLNEHLSLEYTIRFYKNDGIIKEKPLNIEVFIEETFTLFGSEYNKFTEYSSHNWKQILSFLIEYDKGRK